MIKFNKPYLTGKEAHYLYQAVYSGHISGNGLYTKKCQNFFEQKWGFRKTLLTTSCTDALEMAAILCDIKPEDEVIVPSFTFVSSALAFVRQGAKIVFADSKIDNPNIDEYQIEALITNKTKAIVVVHYAGVACNMDKIMKIASKYNIYVIEDAAQAIDSYYNNKPLGSIGHLGTFSFHETKNIQCGEGGLLAINDERFMKRAEIIWEKGTNRAEFFRGEVNKYGWVDTGSSFLPSDFVAAFLYAQLEEISDIQSRRIEIWERYRDNLYKLSKNQITIPEIPSYGTNNAHMFYVLCKSADDRKNLIAFLKEKGIYSVFHYLSLHKSPYYKDLYKGPDLSNSNYYEAHLLRLPFYYEITNDDIDFICAAIKEFFKV